MVTASKGHGCRIGMLSGFASAASNFWAIGLQFGGQMKEPPRTWSDACVWTMALPKVLISGSVESGV